MTLVDPEPVEICNDGSARGEHYAFKVAAAMRVMTLASSSMVTPPTSHVEKTILEPPQDSDE